MKINKIALFSMSLCLMLIFGLIFELFIPSLMFASFVKPSPAEGILIFALVMFGLKSSYLLMINYVLILFSIKGFSVLFIEETAFLIAANTMLISFYLLNKKIKSFWTKSIITILIVTITMTLINAFFITPTFVNLANGKWITYKQMVPTNTFIDMLKFSVRPIPFGGGILHGNIIKYLICFVTAHFAIKTYKIMNKKDR